MLNLINFPHVNISDTLCFLPLGWPGRHGHETLNFIIDPFLMADKLEPASVVPLNGWGREGGGMLIDQQHLALVLD